MSVHRSFGRSVIRSLFWHFASGFRVTAPAQSHETDVVMYTGPPAAPAPHITAPAQPHATMPVCVSGLVVNRPENNREKHFKRDRGGSGHCCHM